MTQKLWTKDGKVVVDSSGKPVLCDECPCGTPCEAEIEALRQEAIAGGYTFLGEGIVVQKFGYRYSGKWYYHEWYRIGQVHRNLICAYETQTHIIGIDCDCNREEISKHGGVQDYYRYLPMPGACSCIDWREILMEYPDVFGVQDYAIGDDAVLDGMSAGSSVHNYFAGCGYATGYVDFRTFVAIAKYGSGKGRESLTVYSVSATSPSTASMWSVAYSTIAFTGTRRKFFADQQGFAEPCVGNTYAVWLTTKQAKVYCPTMAEAQAYAATVEPDYRSVVAVMPSSAARTIHPRVATPDLATSYSYEGFTEDYDPFFYGYNSYNGHRLYDSLSTSEEKKPIYCEQYIRTNIGILTRDGNVGASLHVCGNTDMPEFSGHILWAPFDVTTEMDTDMHWCHPDLFGEDVP